MSRQTLTSDATSACLHILDELCSHPIAEIFMNPVDPELDGVPTYSDIVEHPSDLGTVRANLLAHKYTSLDDFAREVNLIWENAALFNGRHSMVGFMADRLSHIFQKRIGALQGRPPELWTTDYHKSQREMCKLFRGQPSLLEEFNLSPDLEMLVPERKMARQWLSPDDTKFFATAFKFIEDPAQLTKLIHILSETEPGIDVLEEEFQINLAALPQRTVRMLRAWVTDQREQLSRRSMSEPGFTSVVPG